MPAPEWPGRPPAPACPAVEAWAAAVIRGRFAGCLSCYCLRHCHCGRTEPWPFDRARCAGCGLPIRALFPRAFAGRDATGSVERGS